MEMQHVYITGACSNIYFMAFTYSCCRWITFNLVDVLVFSYVNGQIQSSYYWASWKLLISLHICPIIFRMSSLILFNLKARDFMLLKITAQNVYTIEFMNNFGVGNKITSNHIFMMMVYCELVQTLNNISIESSVIIDHNRNYSIDKSSQWFNTKHNDRFIGLIEILSMLHLVYHITFYLDVISADEYSINRNLITV